MALAVDEKTFNQEVLKSTVPVLVNFWAPWCGLCRLVNPLVTRLQTELHEQVQFVTVNADENLKLVNSYRLTTLPTLIVFDQGQVLRRLDKFHTSDELRSAIESLQAVLDQQLAAPSR